MTLQEYTTEELRAELQRRNDLAKAEKTKVKRCKYIAKAIREYCGCECYADKKELKKEKAK